MSDKKKYRTEHDLIGDEDVPVTAYYGIQTQRAMDNFDITGVPIAHFPELIRALAMVKKAAALANHDLRHLDTNKKNAIVAACDEIIHEKKWLEQFPVDLIQGGAGTSTNMNANEVRRDCDNNIWILYFRLLYRKLEYCILFSTHNAAVLFTLLLYRLLRTAAWRLWAEKRGTTSFCTPTTTSTCRSPLTTSTQRRAAWPLYFQMIP